MRPVTVTRRVRCHASRHAVWTHVSNTMRLNRAVGTSRLAVTPKASPGLDRFEVRGRLGGMQVAYVERPFWWSEGAFFGFERAFLSGPARSLSTRYELADVPGTSGCDVTVRVDLVPRVSLLRPVVWFATQRALRQVVRFLASVDEAPRPVVSSPVHSAAVEVARTRLGPEAASEVAERMVEHLGRADDLDLVPIRPFALARKWSLNRMDVLRFCLEAVPAGLLELRWGLICPNCRTTSQVLPSLRDLSESGHCHACDLRYDTDLDRAVEAQFFPHPLVRRVAEQPYCIGGPALTPHVIAQVPLAAGAEGGLDAPPEEGHLQLFVRGGATASVDVTNGAPVAVDVALRAGRVEPALLSIAPRGTLQVTNRSGEGRHVQLQRMGWLSDAATAHQVATMPEFRRLFGAEALRPGLALKVAQAAIVFSDICGSTALYARVGDARAFGLVVDCIGYGTRIVESHGGTLVKTIGDALMAAFADGDQAAAAGAQMIARWPEFVETCALAKAVELKVGVFSGPCMIVNANESLDYFGQTVNAAARIQHLAGPRELVLSADLAEHLGGDSSVEAVEAFAARVKGIDEPLRVVRFRPRRWI